MCVRMSMIMWCTERRIVERARYLGTSERGGFTVSVSLDSGCCVWAMTRMKLLHLRIDHRSSLQLPLLSSLFCFPSHVQLRLSFQICCAHMHSSDQRGRSIAVCATIALLASIITVPGSTDVWGRPTCVTFSSSSSPLRGRVCTAAMRAAASCTTIFTSDMVEYVWNPILMLG